VNLPRADTPLTVRRTIAIAVIGAAPASPSNAQFWFGSDTGTVRAWYPS